MDKHFLIGPQAKVNKGALSYGLAYLIEPEAKTQEVRFIFGLAF
jgi:hypothetical protein